MNALKKKTWAVLLAVSLPLLAGTPSAEEVLDRAADATGKESVYEQVETMYSKGTAKLPQGIEGEMKLFQKSGGKMLMVMAVKAQGLDMEIVQGCDGEDCYVTQSMGGSTMASFKLEGQEKEQLLMERSFDAARQWRDMYETFELVGEEEVEGRNTYKIAFTTNAGMSGTNFYDAENYLLLKSVGKVDGRMGTIEYTTFLYDYQDIEPGLKMPQRFKAIAMGQPIEFTMEETSVNLPIPDSKFAVPEAIKAR